MVTPQGFNALLKLVEEPPDFLVFVFATTEPDKVLPAGVEDVVGRGGGAILHADVVSDVLADAGGGGHPDPDADDRVRLTTAGVDQVIAKPVAGAALVQAIVSVAKDEAVASEAA